MPVELLKGEAEWVLTLSGAVDIFDAARLHAATLEAAEGAVSGVVIQAEGAESLDTCTVQLLLALKRTLAGDGRAMRFEGTPEPVVQLWRLAGLEGQFA